MTQLVGIADNLICSSRSNDEKTTTVTGIQVSASNLEPNFVY